MTDERREAEELVEQVCDVAGITEKQARAVVRLCMERAAGKCNVMASAFEDMPGRTSAGVVAAVALKNASVAILALIPQAPTEGGE